MSKSKTKKDELVIGGVFDEWCPDSKGGVKLHIAVADTAGAVSGHFGHRVRVTIERLANGDISPQKRSGEKEMSKRREMCAQMREALYTLEQASNAVLTNIWPAMTGEGISLSVVATLELRRAIEKARAALDAGESTPEMADAGLSCVQDEQATDVIGSPQMPHPQRVAGGGTWG